MISEIGSVGVIAVVLVLLLVFGNIARKVWMVSRVLKDRDDERDPEVSDEMCDLISRDGITVTECRKDMPGTVQIDGKLYQAVPVKSYSVPSGTKVHVTYIKDGNILTFKVGWIESHENKQGDV